MIYYRLALQGGQPPTWRWKSRVLPSLHEILGLLKMYHSVPKERIRVFLSSSAEETEEMLTRENQGLLSTAVAVDQLWDKHYVSTLEVRRLELELCSGTDHDCPYTFTMPTSTPQVLAWTRLLTKVRQDELQP